MTHLLSRRSFLKGSAAAAAALTSPLLPADAAFLKPKTACSPLSSALCQTQYGPVKGREGKNGLLCWYGIPYGAAPTGESRWTAPQEPACWHTVRDCTSPAPAAYQYTTFPLGTEDCLTLDILFFRRGQKNGPSSSICTAAPPPAHLSSCPAANSCGTRAASLSRSTTGWGCSGGTVCPPSLQTRTHRKLCPAGHRPGAGLGAGQHPPLRRRRRQHHPLWLL